MIYDLDLISMLPTKQAWNLLWKKLDTILPQVDVEISQQDILKEIKIYREEKKLLSE